MGIRIPGGWFAGGGMFIVGLPDDGAAIPIPGGGPIAGPAGALFMGGPNDSGILRSNDTAASLTIPGGNPLPWTTGNTYLYPT